MSNKRSRENDTKDTKETKESIDDDAPVDLMALLEAKNATTLNMKDLPPRNKKGKINYSGYMESYFQERPPIPQTNLVFDSHNLQIIKILDGQY